MSQIQLRRTVETMDEEPLALFIFPGPDETLRLARWRDLVALRDLLIRRQEPRTRKTLRQHPWRMLADKGGGATLVFEPDMPVEGAPLVREWGQPLEPKDLARLGELLYIDSALVSFKEAQKRLSVAYSPLYYASVTTMQIIAFIKGKGRLRQRWVVPLDAVREWAEQRAREEEAAAHE